MHTDSSTFSVYFFMLLIKFYDKQFRHIKTSLGFIIVLFVVSQGTSAMTVPVHPVAKNGVLDLRSAPLTDKIELNGEWLFYWQQLL